MGAKQWFERFKLGLAEQLGGPDPESKRHMSMRLGNWGGVVLIVTAALAQWAPTWAIVAGILIGLTLFFVSFVITNRAIGQQSIRARAHDWIEWKREEQNFRRAVGSIWRQLEGAFSSFRNYTDVDRSLSELVSEADCPDNPDERHDDLMFFFRELMPPEDYESRINLANLEGTLGNRDEPGSRHKLLDKYREAKDVLEVWVIALDVGGGREAALRRVIDGLEKMGHEDSIRLLWYLSIAHTEWKDVVEEPDFSFVSRIRGVMLADDDSG